MLGGLPLPVDSAASASLSAIALIASLKSTLPLRPLLAFQEGFRLRLDLPWCKPIYFLNAVFTKTLFFSSNYPFLPRHSVHSPSAPPTRLCPRTLQTCQVSISSFRVLGFEARCLYTYCVWGIGIEAASRLFVVA
jgi:hypothetical protein